MVFTRQTMAATLYCIVRVLARVCRGAGLLTAMVEMRRSILLWLVSTTSGGGAAKGGTSHATSPGDATRARESVAAGSSSRGPRLSTKEELLETADGWLGHYDDDDVLASADWD